MIQRRKPLKRSTKPLSRTARLRRVSKKRGKALRVYARLRAAFLWDGGWVKVCEVWNCPSLATEVHHKAGRGKNLNNVATWMAVCRPHHEKIHRNPSWARAHNYLT